MPTKLGVCLTSVQKVALSLQSIYNFKNGLNRCMLCDCGKFKESLTDNICICGHTFYEAS
jgi:hypothetical protein